MYRRLVLNQLIVIPDASHERATRSQLCPNLPGGLEEILFGVQVRQSIIHTEHSIEAGFRKLRQAAHIGDVQSEIETSC